MATIKLIPSTYYLSNTSYLSISDAANMYADTSSSTYAMITNSRTSTSSYYVYLRGFNFSDVPSNAVVNSFTIRIKLRESGGSTSTTYAPRICHGTTTYSGITTSAMTNTATTLTFSGTLSWDELIEYGDNLGIRVDCRRNSRYTTSYIYIYGAEIEVDYAIPDPKTVTTSVNGNGTIEPSGVTNTYRGETFNLEIIPTNKSDLVTAIQDGVDVTGQLVPHGAGTTLTFVANNVTTSGIQSGASYAEYAVGHSAESHYSSSNNMYASQNATGYAAYSFDFSDVPSNATIESITVRCYGHRESSTISSTYVSKCAIYNGSTAISEEVDFPTTSDSFINVVASENVTRADLDNLTLRHFVGYYGGLVLGISFNVEYSTGDSVEYYTYSYTVDDDSVIVVTIGGSAKTDSLYFKLNGSWIKAIKVYKKVNNSWAEQIDLTSVFDPNTNYVKG